MTILKVKSLFFLGVCLFLFYTFFPENVYANLGWYDPTGATPMDFTTYATERPRGTPSSRPAPSTTPEPGETGGRAFTRTESKGPPLEKSILIIVENEIFTPPDLNVKNTLLNYIDYLMTDYSRVITYTWTGGFDVPGDLRDLIVSEYNTCDMVGHPLAGCIFIGDLPTAWYSMDDDIPDVESQSIESEFPTDLFFMDLDGNWEMSMTGPGGLYDAHNTTGTGPGTDKEPEIWVARISPSYVNELMTDTEIRSQRINLINQYFNKNINYRQAQMNNELNNFGALIYADQNNFSTDTVLTELEYVYKRGRIILCETGISATDYLDTLNSDNGIELLHAGFTSSAFSHTFQLTTSAGTSTNNGFITTNDIDTINNEIIFYNIVGSSPARFVEDEYMANSYIFNEHTSGLVFIGSTKNGGMQNTKGFYVEFRNSDGLGDNGTVGTCMRSWISDYITGEPETEQERFCYGMTIIGDPTLKRTINPFARAIMSGMETLNEYLININSQPDEDAYGAYKPATTALAVLALLNWDVPESDPAVVNGITYLLNALSGTDADSMRYITGGRNGTYNTSSAILALAATHNPAYHDELRAMRAYLMSIQMDAVSDPVNGPAGEGGFGYGGVEFNSRADNSNSQFAIIGIHTATWELYRDLSNPAAIVGEKNIPVSAYTRSLIWLRNMHTGGGGHLYNLSSSPSLPMTAAAAWNYIFIHDGLQHVPAYIPDGLANIERLMENALSWLISRNPLELSQFTSNRYYYAFTIAVALGMSNSESLFGDWYGTLSSELIGDMVNGHWIHQGSWRLPDAIETAFATLALQVNQNNPLTQRAKRYILTAPADFHVYDFRGNHTGYNNKIRKVEEKIPGSRYFIRDTWNNNEPVTYEFYSENEDPGERFEQEIIIFDPIPGNYRLELQGTGEGDYILAIETWKEDEIQEQVCFYGQIEEFIHEEEPVYTTLVTEDTIADIAGGSPITAGELQVSPILHTDMDDVECVAETAAENSDKADFVFTISETGGATDLEINSIQFTNIFNDYDFTDSIYPVDINIWNFPENTPFTQSTIPPYTTKEVRVEIPVPRGFKGPSSSRFQIISNAGIQYINVTLHSNNPPAAAAGNDQIVYAGSDGTPFAMATLDASGSTDPEGDILTYEWYENNALLSDEMTFDYTFSPGVHTITLVVSDSIEAGSDEVIITVEEPIPGELLITPRNINRGSPGRWVQITMTLPKEIIPEDIILDEVIMLRTPDGDFLDAAQQWIIEESTIGNPNEMYIINDSNIKIGAQFNKSDLCDLIPVNGVASLTVVCNLKTGAFVNGTNTVLIKDPSAKLGHLGLWPFYIDRDTDIETLTASFILPWEIRDEDMDPDAKAVIILPSGETLEPVTQTISPPLKSVSNNENKDNTSRFHSNRKCITANYSMARFLDKVPYNGSVKVYIQYTFKTGEIIYGLAYVTVFTK